MLQQDLQKMSKQELLNLIEAQAKSQVSGLMVKINQSGGVYIRHPLFREFSERTNKEYTAGVNMGFITAKALFNNPELLIQIRDAINSIK